MRVRTRAGSLISGAILAAILAVVLAGDGGAPRKLVDFPKSSIEAPGVFGHDDYVPPPPPSFVYIGPRPTIDSYVLAGLRGGCVYFSIFLVLHLMLRRLRIARRWSYAAAGAAALVAALASLTHPEAWSVLLSRGVVSWYLASGLFLGAVIGFGYHRAAGLEAEGDDPDRLAHVVSRARSSEASEHLEPSPAPAHVQTEGAEYFGGPFRVRTVLPLALLAALLSAGLYIILRTSLGALPELARRVEHGAPFVEAVRLALSSQSLTLVIMGAAAPAPFTLVVLLSHLILRGWGKTSYAAYLAIGAASPVLLSLLLGPLGLLFGLQAMLPMAVAMAIYRNMAGLEPAPVKEDIILNDRRNLVGADHVRRHFGRLVKS